MPPTNNNKKQDKNLTPQIVFTTEPKTRRHKKHFISKDRAIVFMEHLWNLKVKNCSYETLTFEFIQCFGTNDKRTIEKYLGRPEETTRYNGSSNIIRMNRTSGKIAHFHYTNERHIPAKRGLMQDLDYISQVKEGKETRYIIHHELMPYYTIQTTLKNETQETANFLQEHQENLEVSKQDLRVCNAYANPSLKCEAKGEWGKLPLEEKNREVSPETKRGDMGGDKKEKEEEVIDSTHTNLVHSCVTILKKGMETVTP